MTESSDKREKMNFIDTWLLYFGCIKYESYHTCVSHRVTSQYTQIRHNLNSTRTRTRSPRVTALPTELMGLSVLKYNICIIF